MAAWLTVTWNEYAIYLIGGALFAVGGAIYGLMKK